VRLYSRNAYDWTVRLAAIAAAAEVIKAKSFRIDGEAVVLGPDGLSRFEELARRDAARTAILPFPGFENPDWRSAASADRLDCRSDLSESGRRTTMRRLRPLVTTPQSPRRSGPP
jgi:hypothetical protein